jgi:hypothetical protein
MTAMVSEAADIIVVGSGGAGQGGYASLCHAHCLGRAFTSGRLAGRGAGFAT